MRRSLVFMLTAMTVCFSCSKDSIKAGDPVEIYQLETYRTLAGKCQIDPVVTILEDAPTVRKQDILEYSKSDYQFKLTDDAFQKIKAFIDKTPFAVTVDKQVIYYGFFKPTISSSSCDHSITMDVAWGSGNRIALKLGYPGQLQGVTIDDKRNDSKLLEALKRQGKLR